MATTTPLTQQFLIDKWFIARTLQVVLFGLSLGIGTACFFNLYPVNEAIFGIQLNVNVPITSAWISRVSNTYNEFAGLSQVLQFAWLSTFVMILANLLVAMPELRRNKLSGDIIVRSPIHKRLYHNWFRMTPWSSKKKILASDEAADLALAKMDTRHLVQRPAVFYVFGTVVVLIYFSATSDAGLIDINRKFVFVGYPILIFGAGTLITEAVLYFYAAIVGSFKVSKTSVGE